MRSRVVHLLPVVALWTMGAFALIGLMTIPIPHFHFSGDGAIKEAMIRRWIEQGTLSSDLAWTAAPEWVRGNPRVYPIPVIAPFAYEGQLVFPPFFQLFSLPLFRVFGYYGLYILPALSMLGLWLLIGLRTAKASEGYGPAFVASVAIIFSPLTFYGAMFWEHVPALFLFVSSYFLWQLAFREPSRMGLSGAASALGAMAVVLRPELSFAAALMIGYGCRKTGSWKATAASMVGVSLFFFILNKISTGHYFGLHHLQEKNLRSDDVLLWLRLYFGGWSWDMVSQYPVIAMILVASIAVTIKQKENREALLLPVALILVSSLGTPLIVPNSGGMQIFRRYDLILIPIAAIASAELTRRHRLFGWSVLLLVFSSLPARYHDYSFFRWAYLNSMKPTLELFENHPPEAIVTNHTAVALEFAHFIPSIPFYLVRSDADIFPFLSEVAQRHDISKVALVCNPLDERIPVSFALPSGGKGRAVPQKLGNSKFQVWSLSVGVD